MTSFTPSSSCCLKGSLDHRAAARRRRRTNRQHHRLTTFEHRHRRRVACSLRCVRVALRHQLFQPQGAQGAVLETYDATGALLWRVEKAAVRVAPSEPASGFTGFTRGIILPAPDGSLALIGLNGYFPGTQIERFAL